MSLLRRFLYGASAALAAFVLILGIAAETAESVAAAIPHSASLPTVTGVNPENGYALALTPVTITGTNFTGATAVDFGSTPGTNLDVVSPTTITVTTPQLTQQVVNVTVTTPAGTSAVSSATTYTFANPVPTEDHFFGYWLVGSDGGVFSFGDSPFYGSTGSLKLQRPVVGIAAPSTNGPIPQGYWLVASDGGVFSYGASQFFGSLPGLGLHPAGSGLPNSLNAPIVGMVPSLNKGGYLLVGADGSVFAFGDAQYEGSCPGIAGCVGAAVAVLPDATGNGYWVVTNSGQVYAFGDAIYYGPPGKKGSAVTSAVRTPDGGGYWVLLANGSVLPYGDAINFGSPTPGTFGGTNPAAAIFTNLQGYGYGVASANGTVDTFGFVMNFGGMSATRLNSQIIAATGF